mmetsp:Transcript_14932/g.22468  ORF Transcript_14932/g.22468 Transcript_14932/m.22468 type:complete len:203 (-) Transcript_14932:178-786(-)
MDNVAEQADLEFIASTVPYYPFHGVPRFYDISGMLANPDAFQRCIDIFVKKYKDLQVDFIAGLDARGFIYGPPLALALKKPFVMIRKAGKLPNATTGAEYFKEYKGASATGGDTLCMPRNVVAPGSRILVIDDLMATGGTLIAACDLLTSVGAEIVECAVIVELKALGGVDKLKAKHPTANVWSLLDESMLQLEGVVEEDRA